MPFLLLINVDYTWESICYWILLQETGDPYWLHVYRVPLLFVIVITGQNNPLLPHVLDNLASNPSWNLCTFFQPSLTAIRPVALTHPGRTLWWLDMVDSAKWESLQHDDNNHWIRFDVVGECSCYSTRQSLRQSGMSGSYEECLMPPDFDYSLCERTTVTFSPLGLITHTVTW